MEQNTSRMPGTPILLGIGVFVVLALIVAVALGRDVRTYESGTPEAVAQAYIQALFDDEPDVAHGYLSAELRAQCAPGDLDLWWARNADSATFDEVRVEGDHAEIEMRLVSADYEPGFFPFDSYDYAQETELELDVESGEWVITNATWPLAGCIWRQ